MDHRTASRTALTPGVFAARLRQTVADDPTAPIVAGVQGSGGHGKTTLLNALFQTYREAGVQVRTTPGGHGDCAVLIDDAHHLDADSLRALRMVAESPGSRLIIAYRPWPRSPAMSELIGVLSRTGPPVLLGALTLEEVAEQVQQVLGVAAPHALVERIYVQTGGVPRLVGRVLAALSAREVGPSGELRIPKFVLEQFHHELDQLDSTARASLTAVAVGAAPHPRLLAWLLNISTEAADTALSAIRTCGLLNSDDALFPIARQAVLALTPWERRLAILRPLVDAQMQRGGPVLGLVQPLLGAEVALLPEATMATAFGKAGDEALLEAPALAAQLYDAAVSAGIPEASVAARRARATAECGDLDEALRLADRVLVDETTSDRALGVQVASTVMAHRGLLSRSADLCSWSVDNIRWPGDLASAVVGLLGTGELDQARELLRTSRDPGPPTSASGAAKKLAEGMYESISGSPTVALSALVRAVSLAEPVGRNTLVPDTSAAVAAVVAMHCGEFDVAESIVDRVLESGAGGPMLQVRHRLLAAWLPLLRGDTAAAGARLAAAGDPAKMEVRDRLHAVALETGIANRDNDVATLSEVRGRARKAIAEHPVDLFTLLPLGEFVVTAARLREPDWLAPYLAQAWALLSNLGNPPLWTLLLHWKCLHAAIVLEDLDMAKQHVAALIEVADHTALSGPMSEGGQAWMQVLSEDIDQDVVERAARGLHAAGLAWDGARLAGQAAIRTTDRKAMLGLLECARSLQGKPPRPKSMKSDSGAELLSGREKEVAELVLAGNTYKQVGKRLFISAKTVEHHIGRIKQRLGCTSREELLTRLRGLLDA